MTFVDLHIHTTFSDSTDTPSEVIREARSNNIGCVGITDHDTTEGIGAAMTAAREFGIEVVPGIELSSEWNGRDVHILGYLFDHEDEAFNQRLTLIQDTRVSRMVKMINKLKELGIDNIELDDVCALADSDSLGRPHLALLLKDKGWVKDIKEAFDRYLAEGQPVYVPKFKQSPEEAIRLIHSVNGLAVLAHPMVTQIDETIPMLVASGLDGLEVYYPNTSTSLRDYYFGLARKHGLIVTGGSDSHGRGKQKEKIGDVKIPYTVVEDMKARSRERSTNASKGGAAQGPRDGAAEGHQLEAKDESTDRIDKGRPE